MALAGRIRPAGSSLETPGLGPTPETENRLPVAISVALMGTCDAPVLQQAPFCVRILLPLGPRSLAFTGDFTYLLSK